MNGVQKPIRHVTNSCNVTAMAAQLTCGVCGVGFYARSDAIYCSSACRQKAHRARMARRIAGLAGRHRPRARSVRVVTKPDVAGTVQRARHEQHRARELCRTAADTVRHTVASRRRLWDVARPSLLRPDQTAGTGECG
jgi:hypothetical protein